MKESNLIEDISILIVEDEVELLEYLKEYLEIFFKNVFVATCGKQGYEVYLQKRPDIILSDINMPNLDGLSMVRQIRKDDIQTDVIIMSAYSQRDKLLAAIELGLVTYLIKPIESQKLKEVLFDVVKKIRDTKKRIYLVDDIYWDLATSTLWDKTTQIKLKEREVLLFQLLCLEKDRIYTSRDIFNYIYAHQEDKQFSEYSITSFIKRLRAKLPANLIENEYGSGYKVVLRD